MPANETFKHSVQAPGNRGGMQEGAVGQRKAEEFGEFVRKPLIYIAKERQSLSAGQLTTPLRSIIRYQYF